MNTYEFYTMLYFRCLSTSWVQTGTQFTSLDVATTSRTWYPVTHRSPCFLHGCNLHYIYSSSIFLNSFSRSYIQHYQQIPRRLQTHRFFQQCKNVKQSSACIAPPFPTSFGSAPYNAYICLLTVLLHSQYIPVLFLLLTPPAHSQMKSR